MRDLPQYPASASNMYLNALAGAVYVTFIILSPRFLDFQNPFLVVLCGIALAAAILVIGELSFLKVHHRSEVGLLPVSERKKDSARRNLKLLAYYATLAFVFLSYDLVPLYNSEGYEIFTLFMLVALIPAMLIGWFYISEFDGRFKNPHDGLWHFGNFLLARRGVYDGRAVWSYLRSVFLRFFFIPAMFVLLMGYTTSVLGGMEQVMQQGQGALNMSASTNVLLFKYILIAYGLFACIDVMFALLGYLVNFRFLDTHIRSTERTFLGWAVCLICYYPFWPFFEKVMLSALYDNGSWDRWFVNYPVLGAIWGMLAVLAMCCESSGPLTFGIRFSNLTYRGVITNGLYRFTKHPQYLSKLANRFLVFMPFVSMGGILGVTEAMLAYCILCVIYYLRARTEENHLVQYPEYVQYAEWINENGVFRKLGKALPFLRFSAEKARLGKLF